MCLAAGVAVARILLSLYGPAGAPQSVRVPSGSPHVIVEPAFAARRPPARPSGRFARGTGAVPRSEDPRTDRTEPRQHAQSAPR
jgi:hypothetical protein